MLDVRASECSEYSECSYNKQSTYLIQLKIHYHRFFQIGVNWIKMD